MENKQFVEFDGKKVLVTGASSGIGRAISIELNRRGASVVLMGRSHDRLKEVATSLCNSDYHIICLDLKEHSEILPTIKEFSRKNGRIYGMCHCAGVVTTRPLSSCNVESVQSMLDINLLSGIEVARAVCRRDIMEEDAGAILFISSVYGLVGMSGQIGYSASKGAVSTAARAMAVELARRRIRVNSLSPGLVRTDMTNKPLSMLSKSQVKDLEESFPLGVGKPEDVARAAVFLLAPQSSWITGVNLVVDGGFTAK